jgi:hypothetical protein
VAVVAGPPPIPLPLPLDVSVESRLVMAPVRTPREPSNRLNVELPRLASMFVVPPGDDLVSITLVLFEKLAVWLVVSGAA